MKKTFSVLAAAGLLAGLAIQADVAQAAQSLRLGGVHSPTSFETRGLNEFARLVEAKTGGSVKVEVFPAGQLGDAVTMIENVMMGALDMFANVADWNQNVIKDYGILAMPFAFRDQAHLAKFLESDLYAGMKKEMLEKKQLRVVADNWYRIPRVLVTKKPVFSLDDLKDRKLRMGNIKSYLETWKALGANPTVIPWSESYLALRTGVVEGMDSPLSAIYPQKFYQAASYITLTNHSVTPFNVLISDRVFQKLSTDQQAALVAAGREAGEFYTNSINSEFADHKQKMLKEGAVFVEIGLGKFAERAQTVAEKFEKEGAWTPGLFAAVQKLAD